MKPCHFTVSRHANTITIRNRRRCRACPRWRRRAPGDRVAGRGAGRRWPRASCRRARGQPRSSGEQRTVVHRMHSPNQHHDGGCGTGAETSAPLAHCSSEMVAAAFPTSKCRGSRPVDHTSVTARPSPSPRSACRRSPVTNNSACSRRAAATWRMSSERQPIAGVRPVSSSALSCSVRPRRDRARSTVRRAFWCDRWQEDLLHSARTTRQ